MTREPGQILQHYRLIEKIGQGGMGSVWRARDTTLDRDAAIKILPDELANDSQFLARFDREAKLLASLNHANLAAVFGVHDADSTRFLAMELVPGEDLAERLQRGPLPVDEVIPVMGQVADALEAAHEKGVIHRDLKPANIRLTPDGRVKVLDFGLAKAVEGDAASGSGTGSATDQPLTATGVVLGTAPYMSPEQIRGRRVDARTDVWSFGCVVWECLTGKKPFPGETVPDQITAILNNEPDWKKLPAGTPGSLARLLRRCLSKLPRERLHHIADARIELEEAGTELGAEPSTPDGAARAAARQRFAVPLLAAALVAAVVTLFFALGEGDDATRLRESLLVNARFTKLTDFPGEELDAAISPDGRFVTFLSNNSGPFDVYVGRIGAGEYLDVSSGVRIQGPKLTVRRVGVQGNGDGLWLGGSIGRKLGLVPLMGGQVRNWLREHTIHVDWSPDGSRILYSLGSGGDPVFLAAANGANPEEVPLPTEKGFHQHFPTWSPDGLWVYLVRGRVVTGAMDLWRVRPDGTRLEQLTKNLRNVAHPAPIDPRTVLFVAREPGGAGPWLWALDVETGVSRRATLGVERYTSVSASRNGRRLVATVANPRIGLWTVPILSEGEATEDDVKPHPLAAVRALAPRIRGDQLFYLSSIGGGDGLWRHRDGKTVEIWKGGDAALLENSCAVSRDGTRIAIVVREATRGRLYVINADGTEPRALMDDVDVAGAACWSPDDLWVVVGGSKGGRKGLYKVRVRDGQTEGIVQVEAMNPVWSPDGRMIVYAGAQIGPLMHLRAVAPDGGPIDGFPMIKVPAFGERARFLPDGSGIVYVRGLDPDYDFHLLDLESRRSRPLTKLAHSSTMRTFDITPDGKTIVLDRRRDNSDIVLIERDVGK